jgi:hypothetical protein
MTTHRLFLLTVSMFAALLASSCAPAVTSTTAITTDTSIPATAAPADSSTPEATASPQGPVPPSTQTVEVQAVATSRGPDLEATDPTTVNLASGQLQLVEFFRFT